MSVEPENKPALRPEDVREIEFEVMDEGGAPTADGRGMSAQDMLRAGPELVLQAFRGMLKEKFKRWFIRSLVWGTVLGFFAMEQTWAKWAFGIWAFIAGVQLAILVWSWRAGARHVDRLAQVFGGMMPGGPGERRMPNHRDESG
jgi:hypothetical protein